MRALFAKAITSAVLLFLLLFLLPVSGYSISPGKTLVQPPATAQTQAADNTGTNGSTAPAVNVSTLRDRTAFLSQWLHMLDEGSEISDVENSSVMAFVKHVPGDLARVLKSVGGERGFAGLLAAIVISLVSIVLGWLTTSAAKRLAGKISAHLEQITPPDDTRTARLWCGFINHLPSLTLLILFAIVTTLIFLLIGSSVSVNGRMLFQLLLGIVLITRFLSLVGRIILAPVNKNNRPIEISDSVSKAVYRAFTVATSSILSGLLCLRFIRELGALSQTITWMEILLGTIIIGIFVYLVIRLREPVSRILQSENDHQQKGWIQKLLPLYWHIPVLLYLLVIWFVWMGQEVTGTLARNGSFLVSLIIIPLYLALSHAGYLVIRAVIDSLGIGQQAKVDMITKELIPINEQEIKQQIDALVSKTHFVFKILLFASLATWLLSLWGYDIPFAAQAVRAIFESLIIISLAIMLWRYSSRYIARKIAEAMPEVAENEEDDDNEFGGAAPRGRSSTLLPMIRKVLGTFLIIMVTLIVLSSLGVNISPLLAGAGVAGLAIGFGARKLVSDVLSGFFFLLDDAFRVGEYIQAGSIRGTVEAITLRNVMLRHHLGMLQIVPHSDLGAVTNFMRGGMIIKFPLEFPYDTDIDKVRKIIKKVGEEMLQDEELGDDFLQPIKSQGVYNISNSVMVIRVKFTAKPGKQFVIKREAFRRLTEAFNAKGIHYAHRKVIVDIADDTHHNLNDAEKTKLLEAGAAVALMQQQEEELKAQEDDKKK